MVFKEGWIAIYKIVLTIMKQFREDLLKIKEGGDILVALKNNEMFIQNMSTSSV